MVSAGLIRVVTTVLELRWDVFRRDSSRASRYLPSPSTTLIHVRRMLLLGCPPRSRDSGRRAAARTRTSACRSRSRPLIDDPAGSCRAGQGSFAPFSAASVVQSKLSFSDEVRVARAPSAAAAHARLARRRGPLRPACAPSAFRRNAEAELDDRSVRLHGGRPLARRPRRRFVACAPRDGVGKTRGGRRRVRVRRPRPLGARDAPLGPPCAQLPVRAGPRIVPTRRALSHPLSPWSASRGR